MDVTIGSDPEFALKEVGTGKQIRAEAINNFCFNINKVGEVGLDGHPHIAELRPRYSADVREHIHNISYLLGALSVRLIDNNYSNIGIYGGSWVKSQSSEIDDGDGIGGHVHFGLASGRSMGGTLRQNLTHALDYWFAPVIMLIEGRKNALYRRTVGTHGHAYGLLGSDRSRQQPWGMEYRPLSSWLVAPHIAQGVLCYAKTIAHAVVNNNLPPRPYDVSHSVLAARYRDVDTKWLRRHFEKVRKTWRLFPLVTENKYIASGMGILNHLIMSKLEWREEIDMRDNWHVRVKPLQKPEKQVEHGSGDSPPYIDLNTGSATFSSGNTIRINHTTGDYTWTASTDSNAPF